jgi:DNA polymerase-3 subunit alpha
VVEVTIHNELLDANRNILREDEFLLLVGKVSEDRFNGGLRITAEKAFELAEILQPYRQEAGLRVSLRLAPQGISCVMQLGAKEVVVEY